MPEGIGYGPEVPPSAVGAEIPGGMPGGAPDPMMNPSMMDDDALIAMMFAQVMQGIDGQQAAISGAKDLLLQALMEAAEAVGGPAPGSTAVFEGAPPAAMEGMLAGAQDAPVGPMGPMPGGAPEGAAPSPDEAAMLAAMLGGAA